MENPDRNPAVFFGVVKPNNGEDLPLPRRQLAARSFRSVIYHALIQARVFHIDQADAIISPVNGVERIDLFLELPSREKVSQVFGC